MFRAWRWRVFGLTTPNPWDPIVELYKLGVAPIGYRVIDGEVVFVIYAPAVTS